MTKLATICYIDNGKELLLLHRNKKPNDVHEGKWISVGGKLEAGKFVYDRNQNLVDKTVTFYDK